MKNEKKFCLIFKVILNDNIVYLTNTILNISTKIDMLNIIYIIYIIYVYSKKIVKYNWTTISILLNILWVVVMTIWWKYMKIVKNIIKLKLVDYYCWISSGGK